MTTGKIIALTTWHFVNKVISLFFNMLSRFVIAFLSRSKHPLISWLLSLSAVFLEAKKIKSVTVSTFPHLFAMKRRDRMPWSQFFECCVLSQLFNSPPPYQEALCWMVLIIACRPGFHPWVGKIPWKRERLPTPVFWPGEFHGLCSQWGHRFWHDWETFISFGF